MSEKIKKEASDSAAENTIVYMTGRKTTAFAKNIRKTSETQKDLMIEYFETHDGAIDVVSANNTDAEVKRRIWTEIANILNKVPGGTKKNDLKWAKTWADMKLYTKNRARAAKAGTAAPNARKPSELDRRVLRVTGHEDLLNDWEASLNDGTDINTSTTYEKITVTDSATTQEHEIVVQDPTDYEYIEEDDLTENASQEIQSFYETHDYEFTVQQPEQDFPKKRKRTEGEEVQKRVKAGKATIVEVVSEEQAQEETQGDPMVGAINNLANALQNVAAALSSIADVAKNLNRR
ncbi:uncharacterized protein LOC134831397 [Culicoides brevitarsis]|uniref:uncharacterized protein LOC134831397 n=1 Tax=Culicoides brevitarsis TaxID=469753 RepID=UPI00307BDA58